MGTAVSRRARYGEAGDPVQGIAVGAALRPGRAPRASAPVFRIKEKG
jgi:hypothetical protein